MIIENIMKDYKIINRCQISRSKFLKKILSLSFITPVNKMFKVSAKKVNQNFFETDLFYCKKSELLEKNTIVKKNLKKISYKEKFIIPLTKPKIIS